MSEGVFSDFPTVYVSVSTYDNKVGSVSFSRAVSCKLQVLRRADIGNNRDSEK